MRLEVIAESEGKWSRSNRDSYLVRRFLDGHFLAAVADGCAGSRDYGTRMKVARASRAAIRFLEQSAERDKQRPLNEIVAETEKRFLASRVSKRTTLTPLVIRDGKLEAAEVGDSLLYLVRDREAIELVTPQSLRYKLELSAGKHPSQISLDDLLELVDNRSPKFQLGITVQVRNIGCQIFDLTIREDDSSGYMASKELIKEYAKFLDPDPMYSNQTRYGLSKCERRELDILQARIAHQFWDSAKASCYCDWGYIYSYLGAGETVIGGFSQTAQYLVEDGGIQLFAGDQLILATDGAFLHMKKKYSLDAPKDWDRSYKERLLIAERIAELDPEQAIREAVHPEVMTDDATLVIVKYLG